MISRLRARIVTRLRGPGAWRAWVGLILLALLSGYALFLLQRDLRSSQIDLGVLLGRLQAGELGLAVLVYSLALALAVAAWSLIMGTLSGYWNIVDHFRIYCVTTVTRRLPGTFWYLLGRVVMYERLGVPRLLVALGGGIEFAVTVLSGLLVLVISWPLVLSARGLNPLWLLLLLALLALLLNPPIMRWLVRRLSPQAGAGELRYRHLLLWVLILAIDWAVGGLLLYVLSTAVHPLPLAALPTVIGVWATAGVAATIFFSFLPVGGATELTIAALLGGLLEPAEALFVALLMRAVLTLMELIYALLGTLLGLPGLRARRAAYQSTTPHQDAEKPEEVVEARPVLPQKRA